MPADENTRLRIRQRFIELMDEDAADAIMESMPPIPWTEIATKSDMARLDTRLDQIDSRLDLIDARFGQHDDRFDRIDDRFDQMEHYISNELVGLEGRLSLRFMEAVRLVVVSVVLLFAGVLGLAATYVATG